jgi:hypothetical protein
MAHRVSFNRTQAQNLRRVYVSVPTRLGRYAGARLFDRAVARSVTTAWHDVHHPLSERNTVTLNIARKAEPPSAMVWKARLTSSFAPRPTWTPVRPSWSREQIAQTDHRSKVQAKQFWAMIQEVRQACAIWRDRY